MSPANGILVTSLGRKQMLLRAVRDGASRSGMGAEQIWGGDCDAHAPARGLCDDFWHMPALRTMSVQSFIAGCLMRGIGYVLPTRDAELPAFARWAPQLAQAGIAVMVSSPAAITRCQDKLMFARALDAFQPGLAIPASTLPQDLRSARLVVKERFGAGSRGIGLNLTLPEARRHAQSMRAPIFQPCIEGCEFSADTYVTRAGECAGCVLRWRDQVHAGESQVTTTFRDVELERLVGALARHLSLRGPAVFQGMAEPGGNVRMIEVNPRFGGASTLSIAAGLDVFGWWLAEASGQFLPDAGFTPPEATLRLVRDNGVDCITVLEGNEVLEA